MSVHVNPETGEVGKCRATNGKCPFGGAEEHHETAQAAREAFEASQDTFSNKKQFGLSMAAENALSMDMTPKPAPAWLGPNAKKQKELFGSEPEYLGTIQTDAGELAVVWQQDSIERSDVSVQLERGYETSQLTLNDPKTGEEMGFIKLGSQTQASLDRSFGTDQYREFAWASDALGGFHGFEDVDVKTWERSVPVREKTGAELVEAKKALWVAAYKCIKTIPAGVDKSELGYIGIYELGVKHAPNDEATLDKELEIPRKELAKKMKATTGWHDDPIIDYIELERPLRGKGTGQALYILAARKLATKGRVLRASGLQTEAAQATWKRMDENPKIPTGTRTKATPESGTEKTYLTLDFTKQENS